MSDPNIYTIGWICAIRTELIAAASFLDEKHGNLEYTPANDNNAYVLGRIGKHNVVIAAPSGQHGLVPAAHIGRDMVRTFRNIRTRLMVGIGGGAPSPKHDIRLGDVIVSSPGNGSGGVYQYDYGKTIQDSTFVVDSHQNQPPPFMSAAVNSLEAQYSLYGHDIERNIENILISNTRLQREFRRPDPSTDRLYNSSYTHPGAKEEECTVLCDISQLARSLEPSEGRDNPTIHYGKIASANQLMRDANVRDKLSHEEDILCFEMEAAGLMNDFPCLVIRGICDYSDTHKNKVWQGYAAMAAAAYTKDLLYTLTPTQVEAGTNDQSLAKAKLKYLPLLHFDDMNERQLKHESILKQNCALGTYQWLFETKEFQVWESQNLGPPTTSQQILLLEGKPGSGKSILITAALNRLKQLDESHRNIHIAFFFDDTKVGLARSSLGLYRSVLSQLLEQIDTFPSMSEVMKNWPTIDTKPWGIHTLKSSISKIVQHLQSRNLRIFVDALNECRDGENVDSVIDFLLGLQKEHERTWLLFATPDKNVFGSRLSSSITIQVDLNNQDGIRRYINAKLPQGLPQDAHARLLNIISERSSNMFLWAQYVVDDVDKWIASGHSGIHLEKRIKATPKNLKEYYCHKFDQIGNDIQDPHKTRSLIDLLQVSMRTLTLEETMSALGHAQDTHDFPEESLTMISPLDAVKRVRALCQGFVEVRVRPKPVPRSSRTSAPSARRTEPPLKRRKLTQDETEQVVQFVHHSVKEFLDDISNGSAKNDWLKSSTAQRHFHVAQICMRTLAKDDPGEAFLLYATQFWTLHSRKGDSAIPDSFKAPRFVYGCNFKTPKLMKKFADAVIRTKYIDADDWPVPRRLTGESSLLMLLAFEGCTKLVGQHAGLCQDEVSCGMSTNVLETALVLAASRGWTDTTHTILKIARRESLDININNVHRSGMTALYSACFRGKIGTVKLLIEEGANILAPCTMPYNLPFHIAVAQGHNEIVAHFIETVEKDKTMLEKLLTSKNSDGCTVLHCNAEHGSYEVFETLSFYVDRFKGILHVKNVAGKTAHQVAIARNSKLAKDLGDMAQ